MEKTREVEYADYFLSAAHASVGSHPQFGHLAFPPDIDAFNLTSRC